ncbi:molybdate ABC transporter permease subunit [Atopomonas sediminilitoris]|uniref:molybdate ABC transporter permease subunit n=1 Tax=Atopomonas sediminilitoris TaxID=2919919 RepID=UPI001F4DC962|nr:molybdate ABC transporter permease subunit [Atopomonas sediminilitoris]MCJ8170746.1 molybdate ABC transporter permease subunit [Atopomonas sediminilitoris]
MLHPDDWQALWLTLQLAVISTLILLVLGAPLAWWLAQRQTRLRALVQTLVALPLVLPPTVLGFYLLLLLAPSGPLVALGLPMLAFSFSGLVLASVLYSLPFVVQPLTAAFRGLDRDWLELAQTLRANRWQCWREIIFPLTRPAFITAAVLAFAHTLGEFGVVLMIGGSIPGETEVLSVALFRHVESLDYARAHQLAGVLLVLSVLALFVAYRGDRRVAL